MKYIEIDTTKGKEDINFKINMSKADAYQIIIWISGMTQGKLEKYGDYEFKKFKTKLILTEEETFNEETEQYEPELKIEFEPTISGSELLCACSIILQGIGELFSSDTNNTSKENK